MANIDYTRINWENGRRTPLGASNLNKEDEAIAQLVNYVNKSGEYTLYANNWEPIDNQRYAYINHIDIQGVYTDNDYPLAQVWGMNEIETDAEMAGQSYIAKVTVDQSGIKVYATNIPEVDLKLILKN